MPPDPAKARQSLETAKIKLAEAKGLAKAGFTAPAVVSGYAAMFHASRALLYRDGVQEKSHYCVIAYVRERYAGQMPTALLTLMDAFRQARHDVMYGFGKAAVKQEDVLLAISNAEALIGAVAGLLK